MARVYQEAHILESLSASVKTLQAQTAELAKFKGLQEEKIKILTLANAELADKCMKLELRMKANEHNNTARSLNAHIAASPNPNHTPLTPLHDLGTNRAIRHFPKHEKDVKTMGQADVIQVLQALDVKSLGMSAAEKKGEVRAQVGLPRESSVTG